MSTNHYHMTQFDLEATISSLQRLVRSRKLGHADMLEKRIQKLQSQLNSLSARRSRETTSAHPH